MSEDDPGPEYYRQGEIGPLEFIEANPHLGWPEANCIKYLYRWRQKNGVKDLKKARWYIDHLISKAEK